MPANRVEFLVDFSGLETLIGAGLALATSDQDQLYLSEVAKAAFAEAEIEFNRSAAAYAAAGGGIKHMYEWGTAGINTGATSVRRPANSPEARLWNTHLIGTGLNLTYTYTFKPSVAFVPKPTKRDTGMSTETIAKLKNHIFVNKAMVMETGMQVIIKRKGNHPWLLLPIFQNNPPAVRAGDIKRGYGLQRGPLSVTPGRSIQGNFTQYWTGFWEQLGEEHVNRLTTEMIESDYLPYMELPSKGGLHPPIPDGIFLAVKREKTRLKKNAQQRAYRRRKKAEALQR